MPRRTNPTDLTSLSQAFAETLTHPVDRAMAENTVRVIDVCSNFAFASLRVEALVDFLAGDSYTVEQIAEDAALLRLTAQLYRWLGETQRIDAARAAELAKELDVAALAFGAMQPTLVTGFVTPMVASD